MDENVRERITATLVEGKPSEYLFAAGRVYKIKIEGEGDLGKIDFRQRPSLNNSISSLECMQLLIGSLIQNGKVPETFIMEYSRKNISES